MLSDGPGAYNIHSTDARISIKSALSVFFSWKLRQCLTLRTDLRPKSVEVELLRKYLTQEETIHFEPCQMKSNE